MTTHTILLPSLLGFSEALHSFIPHFNSTVLSYFSLQFLNQIRTVNFDALGFVCTSWCYTAFVSTADFLGNSIMMPMCYWFCLKVDCGHVAHSGYVASLVNEVHGSRFQLFYKGVIYGAKQIWFGNGHLGFEELEFGERNK
ncbi:hypothetical protein VNO78_14212 [Psophocarpus tetragonolobus]|uniref:Uncharacterized protein n=1 Tax=Psophocarpus tetragonolobus TaxID=3891 RepID=A0AAN9SZP5_PSOTE